MEKKLPAARKTRAEIIAFPLARRGPLLMDTAAALAAMPYEDGREFWVVHVREARKTLRASGVAPAQIKVEIERYRRAVAHQTIVLANYRQRQPEDAA